MNANTKEIRLHAIESENDADRLPDEILRDGEGGSEGSSGSSGGSGSGSGGGSGSGSGSSGSDGGEIYPTLVFPTSGNDSISLFINNCDVTCSVTVTATIETRFINGQFQNTLKSVLCAYLLSGGSATIKEFDENLEEVTVGYYVKGSTYPDSVSGVMFNKQLHSHATLPYEAWNDRNPAHVGGSVSVSVSFSVIETSTSVYVSGVSISWV